MNTDDPQKLPSCFGQLDTVFPMRSDGLRVTPIECLQCLHKTACLRTAMEQSKGMKVREEMIDRAYHGGVIGFLQRWSQKKTIDRLKRKRSSGQS